MPIRLNETLTDKPNSSTEARDFLSKFIEEIQYNPPFPLEESPGGKVGEEINNYYKNYYVPLDACGYIPMLKNQPEEPVSSYEYRILDFCLNPRVETRIFIIHGHTGVGKSSLLRKVLYYWYPQFQELQNKFIPIYIQIKDHMVYNEDEMPVTTQALQKYFEKKIRDNTYYVIKNALIDDGVKIISEMNKKGTYAGSFSDEDIEKIKSRPIEGWLSSFFPESNLRLDFELEVLTQLIRQGKIKITVAIDDVDKYSSRIHISIFSASDYLSTRGISVIACMRTSTYNASANAISQVQDGVMEINLNSGFVETIIKRRIDLAKNEIKLNPDIPYTIKSYRAILGIDVIDLFCTLISRPPCMKTLVGLSNSNIKQVFRKFSLMAQSEAFSDEFIVSALLKRDKVLPTKQNSRKIWVFYHLLFGNKAGTYNRNDGALKAGLVNLYDSNGFDNNPWRYLIRLNILNFLYKVWIHLRDEKHYTKVSILHEKFLQTFGNLVSPTLFEDALLTLIQSELVFMGSCKRYKDEDDLLENVYSDSLIISPSGRFYLENLIHIVEYLYFMKDDILWYQDILPREMVLANRKHNRRKIFTVALEALYLFSKTEWDSLALLRAYWEGQDNGGDCLLRYREDFSPYGITPNLIITYHEMILNSFEEHIKSQLNGNYIGSPQENLINKIRRLDEENEGLKKLFLQA